MGLLVSVLQIYIPEYLRKRALMQLFNCAATAFGAEAPLIAGLDSAGCLARYARFTQTLGQQCLHDGREVAAVEQRLYRGAVEMGRLLGKWLRPGTVHDVMAIGRVLYSMLAIDLRGDARGEVVIERCYFSQFYSREVCWLMSAMDRGLFAGLSNGGELTFTARITEGEPCCRAHFSWEPEARDTR